MTTPLLRSIVAELPQEDALAIMEEYEEYERTAVLAEGTTIRRVLGLLAADPQSVKAPDVLMAVFVALEVYRGFAHRYVDLLD